MNGCALVRPNLRKNRFMSAQTYFLTSLPSLSAPCLSQSSLDDFEEDLPQSLKGEDVDAGLEHTVEEREEEGPVQPLGRLRGGEGGAGKGGAERGDGDEEEAGDENHLDCHTFQLPVKECGQVG